MCVDNPFCFYEYSITLVLCLCWDHIK